MACLKTTTTKEWNYLNDSAARNPVTATEIKCVINFQKRISGYYMLQLFFCILMTTKQHNRSKPIMCRPNRYTTQGMSVMLVNKTLPSLTRPWNLGWLSALQRKWQTQLWQTQFLKEAQNAPMIQRPAKYILVNHSELAHPVAFLKNIHRLGSRGMHCPRAS